MKVFISDLSLLARSHVPESQTGSDSHSRCESSSLGDPAALLQREKRSIWMVLSMVMLVLEGLAGLLFLCSLGFGLPSSVCVSSALLLVTYYSRLQEPHLNVVLNTASFSLAQIYRCDMQPVQD